MTKKYMQKYVDFEITKVLSVLVIKLKNFNNDIENFSVIISDLQPKIKIKWL